MKAKSLLVQAMNGRIRNLWMLIVLALLSIGGGLFFLFKNAPQKDKKDTVLLTKKEGYFAPLKFHGYSFGNVPYLNVIIGDKRISAKIDLSYLGMLSLPSHLIKDIPEKKWIQRIQVYGKDGRTYERDIYEVKKIKIQGASLFPVAHIPCSTIEETGLENMHERILLGKPNPEEHSLGTIGLGLLCNFDLLYFDCKNRALVLCNSIETLKKEGYSIESFTEIPMISNPVCIELEALSEGGPLRCMLDTGSTFNFLNKKFKSGCNDHPTALGGNQEDLIIYNHEEDTQELSSFKIGGKEFGPLTFHRIKYPTDIDVILGMEFFNSHLVLIDFENEKVYLSPYAK